MSYFQDIDYSYYGDREDPEVNVRYFMNHIIMIIDSTKKEEELLRYDLRRLYNLYNSLFIIFSQQTTLARTNPELQHRVSRKLEEIVKLKNRIVDNDGYPLDYENLYKKFESTNKSISNAYNRTIKLMLNTSIKS